MMTKCMYTKTFRSYRNNYFRIEYLYVSILNNMWNKSLNLKKKSRKSIQIS